MSVYRLFKGNAWREKNSWDSATLHWGLKMIFRGERRKEILGKLYIQKLLIQLQSLTLYCMNFYEELKMIHMAVSLFKNKCDHEISNKILLENVLTWNQLRVFSIVYLIWNWSSQLGPECNKGLTTEILILHFKGFRKWTPTSTYILDTILKGWTCFHVSSFSAKHPLRFFHFYRNIFSLSKITSTFIEALSYGTSTRISLFAACVFLKRNRFNRDIYNIAQVQLDSILSIDLEGLLLLLRFTSNWKLPQIERRTTVRRFVQFLLMKNKETFDVCQVEERKPERRPCFSSIKKIITCRG